MVDENLFVAVCIKIFCPGTDAESMPHVTRDKRFLVCIDIHCCAFSHRTGVTILLPYQT